MKIANTGMRKKVIIGVESFLFTLLFNLSAHAGDTTVPYPQEYRQWLHVKSMIIEPGHALANPFQGIHHVYANQKAQTGLENGKYPNGSILVFDLLAYEHNDKSIQEKERKLIGVMVKDDNLYKNTGGWGFEGFAGNSRSKRLVTDNGAACFSCHTAQKGHDYVFSITRQ